MDHGRPRAARLSRALIAAALPLALAAGADRPQLRAEHWLAADGRAEALATQPRECLVIPDDGADRIAIGRTAFRTPALLGGQAAKAGMSCASCHRNGRSNPHFQLEGLSGAPGTADVTSSLMSSHRGNGVFDPRPIPDLAARGKIDRDPARPDLQAFVHGLITEEFDGAEPPPVAMAGLLAYLRAMRPCTGSEPVGLEPALADVATAVSAAASAMREGDAPAARLLLAGARSMLGDIDERYAGFDADRESIAAVDKRLLELQHRADRGGPGAAKRIATWQLPLSLAYALRRDSPDSLYNRARLEALLAGQ